MAPPRKTPVNRGKHPAVAVPDEETHEHEDDALDPKTPTPDPPRPVDTDEDNEDDDGGEGPSMRERLQKTPSRERFHELANQYKKLRMTIQDLQDEIIVFQTDKVETNMIIESLTQERDEAIAHRDHAIRERGDLAFRLVNLQNSNVTSSGAPMMEAVTTRKSTKMPDAPMLSDGKEVRFETWETVIRQKLEANADHYPLPVHRKLYVQSRCEGKAQLHIAPRLRIDASIPYTDADDMIAHLKTVFANPNRRAEAYTAYHKLRMKPKDNFTDFLAEFMQLAEEAVVVEENRKRDLYSKLPYLLQSQVMWAVNQDSVLFDTFTQNCQSMSHEINLQQESKSTFRARTSAPSASSGTGAATTAGSAYTPRVKREGSSGFTSLSTTERETLMKEGRCFNCKEQGHMTRECPKKKSNTATVAVVAPTPHVVEVQELEADQGKASA
ncbi:hypothetical protein N7463_008420 [Penicillium fimorum]|uniref:CCHC-type domain-containing protein n=1 Tax=Penicillium fimorum TaxID=1882269 RepID=A0A9W9XKR0_9EURO|nr:hypothetical protein N7463_010216 [Penicillium fimorum]KAJ5494778.1 hypothetical protein N7463_010865 [Penicillium fimorum]KAJ5496433.1 hypothetical protein N7463_008420 [Penicillium fimorum]